MHNSENRNKCTGVYWLKQSLDKIYIIIKLKSKGEIIKLPKFEEYIEKSYEENLQVLNKNKIEEYTFKWQQKAFSIYEYQKYSNLYNCITETELKYHEMIKGPQIKPNKIFTYIDEDYRVPVPIVGKKSYDELVSTYFNFCFAKLNLDQKIGASKNVSNSIGYLFKSDDNISDNDHWMAMHIVLDNSDYNEDLQLLFKQECILLSLYHNVTHNYMMVSPDVNNLEFNPYPVEADNKIGIEYSIEIDFEEDGSGEELVSLLNNLYKKWEKKQKKLFNFLMPPLGKRKTFITIEIVSATGFEKDNLYLDYQIKIPDDIKYIGDVKGRTHTSKSIQSEDQNHWRYGHIIDLELEYATGIDPPPLKFYVETISIDWWGRHRTEGYCRLLLTLEPGVFKEHLSCSRPEELDIVKAESRRFFVGGCHLIKDFDVFDNPQLQDANFRYMSTGTISFTWRVISQVNTPGSQPPEPHSSASDLMKGAEAVLRQYKKAKATLAAATKCLPNKLNGSGDGE